jgi:hypothetical protein
MTAFENIKTLCSLMSKGKATEYKKMAGLGQNDIDPEISSILSRQEELTRVLEKRGVGGSHGPVTSGYQDENGNWLNFVALVQLFYVDAPRLKEILNEISRTFRVDVMEGQKVTVTGGYDEQAPDLLMAAHYFIGAEELYAVELPTGKLTKITGRQTGGGYFEGDGAVLELIAEEAPTLDTIIHEIIHIRLPEELGQHEQIVDKIAVQLTDILGSFGYDQPLKMREIEDERSQVLEVLQVLDADLKQFLPPAM